MTTMSFLRRLERGKVSKKHMKSWKKNMHSQKKCFPLVRVSVFHRKPSLKSWAQQRVQYHGWKQSENTLLP